MRDVLNLSRGMSYKDALAGLDLGGGKAVIIGDPADAEVRGAAARLRPLRAVARRALLHRLRRRHLLARTWTTSPASARSSPAAPSPTAARATARCSRRTACSRACGPRAEVAWGTPTLAGRTVGVAGVGKVGRHLVRHLIEDGATVVVTDVHAPSVDAGTPGAAPGDRGRRRPRRWSPRPLDVYAPCALGGALSDEVVDVLTARIVCGAANNQLAHAGIEKALADRGILYAPDYCVNAGGADPGRRRARGLLLRARAASAPSGIFDTTRRVFELAAADGVSPAVAADRLAERRMRDVGRLRGIWLPA